MTITLLALIAVLQQPSQLAFDGPLGNRDGLQPWNIDTLTYLRPVRQVGDWTFEKRSVGDRNADVAVGKFALTGADSTVTGVFPVNPGTRSLQSLDPTRTYLLGGFVREGGVLPFRAFRRNPADPENPVTAFVPRGTDEIMVEAVLPWNSTAPIDPQDRGHSVFLGLAQELVGPNPDDARMARDEFWHLAFKAGMPSQDKWIRESLVPRVTALESQDALEATWVKGLLIRWHIPRAVPDFLSALEAATSDPAILAQPSDQFFISRCYLRNWINFDDPDWAVGPDASKTRLDVADRLAKIAKLTKYPMVQSYALTEFDDARDDARKQVFGLLDSGDDEVVMHVLGHLARWSQKVDRKPVGIGPNKDAYNKHLVKVWKEEGPAAILSGKE